MTTCIITRSGCYRYNAARKAEAVVTATILNCKKRSGKDRCWIQEAVVTAANIYSKNLQPKHE